MPHNADIFVVGTDTGVGKSVVSLLLMQLLFAKGLEPFYLKPFQTGCTDPYDKDSDARFIYEHTGALKGRDPARSVVYCYPGAKAPYIAAMQNDDTIDLDTVRKVVTAKREKYSPLVVEGAGGLLVPVTGNALMVDMVRELACRPLLVARAGLGTINHTLLSLEALRHRQMEPLGVVLLDPAPATEDPELVYENIETIRIRGDVQIGGPICGISDFSNPPPSAYAVLDNLLEW